MHTIELTVPDDASLIPLERALKDYTAARRDSPNATIRYWARVAMPNLLEQIKSQRLGARDV